MYRLTVDPSLPRRSAILVGAALALFGAPEASAQEGRPDRYAIVDAWIVPVSGNRALLGDLSRVAAHHHRVHPHDRG